MLHKEFELQPFDHGSKVAVSQETLENHIQKLYQTVLQEILENHALADWITRQKNKTSQQQSEQHIISAPSIMLNLFSAKQQQYVEVDDDNDNTTSAASMHQIFKASDALLSFQDYMNGLNNLMKERCLCMPETSVGTMKEFWIREKIHQKEIDKLTVNALIIKCI